MPILLGIMAVITTLLLVVGIHEAGHAIVARWSGVAIKSISIGFGPPILCWQDKKQRNWIWALWPLGG
ncbi:MAG TPA: site-2 protease family protein, partial [Legionellaceae bacterium]|nr:site-2 protease family protein [Legionellaceae bacterium]